MTSIAIICIRMKVCVYNYVTTNNNNNNNYSIDLLYPNKLSLTEWMCDNEFDNFLN